MANVDRPQGASPKGEPKRANEYVAGGIVYPGDMVKLNSAGRVVAASASDALCGVALSYAGAAGEKLIVSDDINQLYVIQADGTDIDAETDINLNYNIVATGGSTKYKLSRMELDSDTGATSSILPLKLLGIERAADNALGEFVDCIVKINNNQLAGGTGTEGV